MGVLLVVGVVALAASTAIIVTTILVFEGRDDV